MLRRVLPALTSVLLIGFAVIANAQGECSAIVRQAITRTDEQCSNTGRNQACHGFSHVDAQPRAGAEVFPFELGDIADLVNIRSLTTFPYNETTGEWGIALLKVQADLPDALPGTNVTFIMFGDAQIEDLSGDHAANPIQMFRLRSGLTGRRCDVMPDDGLLIQTPHGTGRITLQINGVNISLGSTVFFEAQPNGLFTVSTLEGAAQFTLDGESQTARPGQSISVSMDNTLRPASRVNPPSPYDTEAIRTLPIALLERHVALGETVILSDLPRGDEALNPLNCIGMNNTSVFNCYLENKGSAGVRVTTAPEINVQPSGGNNQSGANNPSGQSGDGGTNNPNNQGSNGGANNPDEQGGNDNGDDDDDDGGDDDDD
jgi:hypothetical protein